MSYLLLLIPFTLLIILNLLSKRIRERVAFWSTLAVLLLQAIVAALIPFGLLNQISLPNLETVLGFRLLLNGLGAFLIFSAGLAGLTALFIEKFVSIDNDDRFNFKNLLLIATIGINGIALVTDLFSLYIFIEVTALATYILINLSRENDVREAVFKYLIQSVIASTLMLAAIALFLIIAHGTSYIEIRESMRVSSTSFIPHLAVGLFICGLFIKGGLVPFHGWLPDAYMVAPASVSVYLGGVVTKASGIYPLIILLSFVFGFDPQIRTVVMLLGLISIYVGALAALGQDDIKRMLAYSSISQVGYIVLALGIGSKIGVFAAMFHFLNHAVFKTQLFANAAAVESQVGRNMNDLGGLASKMPVTGVTTLIASLSTAGLPPLAGFWSKLFIIMALWIAGYYLYAFLAVFASVITLAYFLSLQRRVFFGKIAEGLNKAQEVGFLTLLPVVVLSALTIIMGLIFPFMFKLFVR